MNQIHVYDNKKIEMAIDKIKASVADINSEAEICRKSLLDKINTETNAKRIELWENLINELFGNAQYNYSILEEFTRNVDNIDKIVKKVNSSLEKAVLKEQENIIKEQAALIEEQKDIINQLRSGTYVENNENVVEYTEEENYVDNNINEVQSEEDLNKEPEKVSEEQNINDEQVDVEVPVVETEQVVTEEPVVEEEQEEKPFVVEEYDDVEKTPLEEVAQPDAMVENTEEPPMIIDIPIYVREDENIAVEPVIKSEREEISPSFVIEPMVNEEPVVNEFDVNDFEKEFNNDLAVIVEEEVNKLRFIDNGARPIMIGKGQAEKLDASKSTQEVLVKERKTIGSYVPGQEDTTIINVQEEPIMVSEFSIDNEAKVDAEIEAAVNEGEKDIEQIISEKMDLAKKLYSEGNAEEANVIMEEISQLNAENKQLVR